MSQPYWFLSETVWVPGLCISSEQTKWILDNWLDGWIDDCKKMFVCFCHFLLCQKKKLHIILRGYLWIVLYLLHCYPIYLPLCSLYTNFSRIKKASRSRYFCETVIRNRYNMSTNYQALCYIVTQLITVAWVSLVIGHISKTYLNPKCLSTH